MILIDRTNSDEKDQLTAEIDTLRKKMSLGGGAVRLHYFIYFIYYSIAAAPFLGRGHIAKGD